MMHAYKPNSQEAETGGSMRPAWSIKRVSGLPGLHRETKNKKSPKQMANTKFKQYLLHCHYKALGLNHLEFSTEY